MRCIRKALWLERNAGRLPVRSSATGDGAIEMVARIQL